MKKHKSRALVLILAVAMVFQFVLFSSQSAWAGSVDVYTGVNEQMDAPEDQATEAGDEAAPADVDQPQETAPGDIPADIDEPTDSEEEPASSDAADEPDAERDG